MLDKLVEEIDALTTKHAKLILVAAQKARASTTSDDSELELLVIKLALITVCKEANELGTDYLLEW